MGRCRHRRAFTLVELLVVIGIIAVLVGVLLPALQSAKRQANAVKCAAAMREIGNFYSFYAAENRSYFPPAKAGDGSDPSNYRMSWADSASSGGRNVDTNSYVYWFTFLFKYASKNGRIGAYTTNADDRARSRNNVLWGCPSFEGIQSMTTNGGVNYQDTGYGMNAYPTYTATYPPVAAPPNEVPASESSVVTSTDYWKTVKNSWWKQKAYTRPAERALIADARFWLLETAAAPLDGTFPGQGIMTDQQTWAGAANNPNDGQTLYDFYRHGKYPNAIGGGATGRFSPVGGKVSFNVLFADGHVTTLTDRAEGYKAARMRYPG